MRTKAQRGTCSFYLFKLNTIKQRNKKTQPTQLRQVQNTLNRTYNHPQLKGENSLPKYGSQSATAIENHTRPNTDIPNHRKNNIDYPPNSRPDHTKTKT